MAANISVFSFWPVRQHIFELGVGYGIAGSDSEPVENPEPEETPASNPQTNSVQPEDNVQAESGDSEKTQSEEPLQEQVEEETENITERSTEIDYLPSYIGGIHDIRYSCMAIQISEEK